MRERRVFQSISDFARAHLVKIDFKFDCVGDLIITMEPRTYGYTPYRISRAIDSSELNFAEDCDDIIFYHLKIMLVEIIDMQRERKDNDKS